MKAASSVVGQDLGRPAQPGAGVTCQISPVEPSATVKLAQSAQSGGADLRMVEVGASAESPISEAAGSQEKPADQPQPSVLPPNGTEAPETTAGLDESASILQAFLTSISKLDDLKFFTEPVRVEDAPGYFNVIKQPMDLQTMSEKAKRHEYATWSDFVDDFKLMCNNAMLYNQKRSRVHKTAVTMLRAGIKQLQHMEMEGCKALGCPYPSPAPIQPAVSLGNGTPANLGSGLSIVSKPSASPSLPEAASGLQRMPSRVPTKPPPKSNLGPPKKPNKPSPPKKARGAPQKASTGPSKPRQPASSIALAEADDWQADVPLDDDVRYSSFSDSDLDNTVPPPPTATAISSRQWTLWLGQPVLTHQIRPPNTSPTDGSIVTGSAMSALEGKQAAVELWKTQRRGAEWRIRWLELRLQELAGRQQRYQHELTLAQQQAAAQPPPLSPSAPPPQQPSHLNGAQTGTGARDRGSGPLSAASGQLQTAGPRPGPTSEQAGMLAASPPSPPSQAAAPVITPHADLPAGNPLVPPPDTGAIQGTASMRPFHATSSAPAESHGPQDGAQQAQLKPHDSAPHESALHESASGAAPSSQLPGRLRHGRTALQLLDLEHISAHPFFAAHSGDRRLKQAVLDVEDANLDEADLAPCAFAALDALEARLEILQMQMQQVPGVARPAQAGAGSGMRHRGRGRGPQKRMRVGLPTHSFLDRQVSKRRRDDGDWGDGLASHQSLPKVERLQVTTISTPAVRHLAAEELLARQAEIRMHRARLAAAAAGKPQSSGTQQESGSSSEDTSDEAYANLHAAHETEEHLRFTAAAGGGGAKKKPPSKAELRTSLDAKATQGMQLPPAASAPSALAPSLKVSTRTPAAAEQATAGTPAANSPSSPSRRVAASDKAQGAASEGVVPPTGSPRAGGGRGGAGRKGARSANSEAFAHAGRPRGRPPTSHHHRGRGRGGHGPGRPGRGAGRNSAADRQNGVAQATAQANGPAAAGVSEAAPESAPDKTGEEKE